MAKFGFFVDVFSHCNLRCPSCLVGNKYGTPSEWPKGLMSPATLGQILDKAQSECSVEWVALFNWTEPLLHPNIADLVQVARSRNIPVSLSSNLNVLPKPDDLLAAGPNFLRISLSGFTQAVYERGHREGDIDAVKRNMVRLAEAKARTESQTSIEVFYHRYAYNLHEVAPMQAFATSLGFGFQSYLAQIYPVEKIIDIARGNITDADRLVLENLALPLDKALAFTAAKGSTTCTLLDDQVSIDVNGNVTLCCASSMDRVNSIGRFLDLPIEEIQRRRRLHSLCRACGELGIPDYLKSQPEFEGIAEAALGASALND
jgi:MoaA/NifB/PqqE/SkfB family radical SAM enzyme